jgi:hypothetical protein
VSDGAVIVLGIHPDCRRVNYHNGPRHSSLWRAFFLHVDLNSLLLTGPPIYPSWQFLAVGGLALAGRLWFAMHRTAGGLFTLQDCEVSFGGLACPAIDSGRLAVDFGRWSVIGCVPVDVRNPRPARHASERQR